MNKEFWVKQKLTNMLDKQAVKLGRKLDTADDGEFCKLIDRIDAVEELKAKINKPGIFKQKEFWVEVIKIVGVAAALGAVIVYDSKGHILPKNLDKWIPGPRL